MIESLIEKLPTASADREDLPDRDGAASADMQDTFLAALPVVQLIVRRRRSALPAADLPDLSQGIALRLWKWRERYREKSRRHVRRRMGVIRRPDRIQRDQPPPLKFFAGRSVLMMKPILRRYRIFPQAASKARPRRKYFP